jgi:hypothetical protein
MSSPDLDFCSTAAMSSIMCLEGKRWPISHDSLFPLLHSGQKIRVSPQEFTGYSILSLTYFC